LSRSNERSNRRQIAARRSVSSPAAALNAAVDILPLDAIAGRITELAIARLTRVRR